MALIGTLQDPFQSGAFSANWDAAFNSTDSTKVINANNRLEITGTTAIYFNSLIGSTTYDVTGGQEFVQVIDAGDQTITSHEAGLQLVIDANNVTWIFIATNSITAYKRVAGVQAQIATVGSAYKLGVWLRIRESAGTFYYGYSYDGSGYTEFATLANPFGTTSFKPCIYSQQWQAETTSSYAYFDNYNIPKTSMFNHLSVGNGMSRSEMAN